MKSFEKVTNDIFNAIDKIEYSDKSDKACQTQLMLTLYQMLRNEETYNEALKCLQEHESDKKRSNTLVYKSKTLGL